MHFCRIPTSRREWGHAVAGAASDQASKPRNPDRARPSCHLDNRRPYHMGKDPMSGLVLARISLVVSHSIQLPPYLPPCSIQSSGFWAVFGIHIRVYQNRTWTHGQKAVRRDVPILGIHA